MANVIYRGPHNRQPRTVSNKPVAAALLPGTFVVEGTDSLTQATSAKGLIRLLSHRDFYASFDAAFNDTSPLKQPYKAGETGVAYILEPTQQYVAAVAEATYSVGQPLTVGAAGRMTAAQAGDLVVAWCMEAGARVAGELVDVEVTNFYTL
ncbi:hypothetical protein WAE61_08960 [Comamonadaceae bacterium PP-2]